MIDKGKGTLSYITGLIGSLLVLYVVKNNTKKDVMHAAQGVVLGIFKIASTFLASGINAFVSAATINSEMPISLAYSSIIPLLLFIITVVGLIKVYTNADAKIPVIGDIAESMFKSKLDAAPEYYDYSNYNSTNSAQTVVDDEINFDPQTGERIKK